MRVDRVIRIQEQRIGEMPPPRPMVSMAGMRQAETAPPPIEAGELEIRANVTLVAAIR
jgi:uncharacterized protein YggE